MDVIGTTLYMGLGCCVGLVGAAICTEVLKGTKIDLSTELKERVMKEGIYHITSKENAEKILAGSFLAPTRGNYSDNGNHYLRSRNTGELADYVYMFAGRPTANMIANNLAIKPLDGTFYAVKHTPDKFDVENYEMRLEDGALVHEGMLDITNSNPEIVRLRVEKGKVTEVPLDYEAPPQMQQAEKRKLTLNPRFLIATAKELSTACKTYKSKMKTFREAVNKRRIENKTFVSQYAIESNRKKYQVEKDGQTYEVATVGNKILDGKKLTEFSVIDSEGNEKQKVYMDKLDIFSISNNKMKEFMTEHIDFFNSQSSYIGRPRVKNSVLVQDIDEEFAKHFEAKQKSREKTEKAYEKFLDENPFKPKGITFFRKFYEAISPKEQRDAFDYIKQKEKNKSKNKKRTHDKSLDEI